MNLIATKSKQFFGNFERTNSELSVARYYFHFTDGKRTFTDGIGLELSGLAAARQQAREQIREMRSCMSEEVQDWAPWKIFVVDRWGKTIFEIGFDLLVSR